ncbi:MAG TPA: hypothetical protein VF064_14725 [Pyrinomonadaceae bacterium]
MAATKKKPTTKKKAAPAKKQKSAAKKKPPQKRAAKKTARATKKRAAKKQATKKGVAKKQATAAKKVAGAAKQKTVVAKKSAAKKSARDVLDLGDVPSALVARYTTALCLACIFDLFTRRLGLTPRTAYTEIRRHEPTIEELTTREPQRPYFRDEGRNPRCPYCAAAPRWHARLATYRVEGGKTTDAARRALVKQLPARDGEFQFIEKKSTARAAFFEWLERLGQELDFDRDERAWMLAATRRYLGRREPRTDWAEVFDGVRQVRRSHLLAEGWEREGPRLFLAPAVYNDVLLVQYLVSRSHRHGGRTFEGRLTLPELVRRMRFSGHLHAQGINDRDQFDVLEKLVEQLTGGDAPLKLHYIIDRRDLLQKVKDVYARYA